MRKILTGVLILCFITFSVPVFADLKFGGMITTEQFYWNVSKERRISGGLPEGASTAVDDISTTEISMPQTYNRFNVKYTSDDQKVGGFIELRYGGQKGGGDSVLGTANPTGENNFNAELAYIDYQVNPRFALRVGRQPQTFAFLVPGQEMGHNHGHSALSGFGNVHGAPSREAIKGFIKFNDYVRLEIAALNPDSDGNGAGGGGWPSPGTRGDLITNRTSPSGIALPNLPAAAGGVAAEENRIPRFDIAAPIKYRNFRIEPSFSWARSAYTEVATGSDDEYDSWGASIGVVAGFGAFTLTGEYTYGQNLGGHSYVGVSNGAPMTYLVGTAVKIRDTTSHSAWLQGDYRFGKFGIQLLAGMEKAENDGNPDVARAADPAEFDITRMAYGLQVPIYLTKNLKVVPQVWYYDYGEDAKLGGTAANPRRGDTDLGSETMVGALWMLVF